MFGTAAPPTNVFVGNYIDCGEPLYCFMYDVKV